MNLKVCKINVDNKFSLLFFYTFDEVAKQLIIYEVAFKHVTSKI